MADLTPRFRERHLLCTCPFIKGPHGFSVIEPQPDCPGDTIAHPPPLTAEQMTELLVAALADLSEVPDAG